jgi:soluble lytic murein transglycosylase-like protein
MALPDWAVDFSWTEIHESAGEFGVDPGLIAAIIQVESAGICLRMRAEPAFKYILTPARFAQRLGITKETEIACQKMSWGLMQVMGGTARELGLEGHLGLLLFPEFGIHYGAKYLGTKVKKYRSMRAAVAAYNAGSLRMTPDGKIVNQEYVDKVMQLYDQVK